MPQVPDVLQKSDFAEVQKNKERMRILRIRGKYCLFLLFLLQLVTSNSRVLGQRDSAAVLGFTSGYDIVSISGPGWASGADSGDLLVELQSKSTGDEPSDFEKILLLRVHKGAYQLIGENEELVMDPAMLGSAGSSSIYLLDSELHVDYHFGSNSSFSRISISFKKNARGQYLFKEYRSTTSHYGKEDLFARVLIQANPADPLTFSEATEAVILNQLSKNRSGMEPENIANNNLSINDAAKKFQKMIPEAYQLISFAIGDLNGDDFVADALLFVQNDEKVSLMLLLENSDGTYRLQSENSGLLLPYYPTEGRPIQNIRLVIKNTYFTIEQRIPTSEMDYEHRYLTFHFNLSHAQFLLHRYDVAYYEGFKNKPIRIIEQKYLRDFGDLSFADIASAPNTFIYETPNTLLSGLVRQKVGGTGNEGADIGSKNNTKNVSDTNKPFTVTTLQLDHPVSVQSPPFSVGSSLVQPSVSNIASVQLLTENRSIALQEFYGKQVLVTGTFLPGTSKQHITPVVFVIHTIQVQ